MVVVEDCDGFWSIFLGEFFVIVYRVLSLANSKNQEALEKYKD